MTFRKFHVALKKEEFEPEQICPAWIKVTRIESFYEFEGRVIIETDCDCFTVTETLEEVYEIVHS